MSNPILQSESFERAAHSLMSAFDHFSRNGITGDIDRFERCTEQFRLSVDKLVTAIGMQAENDQRKVVGASMAYAETDFANL